MTAIYNAFNDDESRFGRLLTSAAHFMLYGLAISIAARIARYCGFSHWTLEIAVLAGFALLTCGIIHNDFTRLCARCMSEVPADASHRAERQQWVLWVRHSLLSIPRAALCIAFFIGVGMLVSRYNLPLVVNLPLDAFWSVFMYSIWLHHRLRPWCPHCPDWGDDGGISEPSPDPVVKATQ